MPDTNFDQLKGLLVTLGTPALSQHFGVRRCEILEGLGTAIIISTLAEAIAMQEGVGAFANTGLRKQILEQASEDQLRSVYEFDDLGPDVLDEINRFSWGSNADSRAFLRLVDISEDALDIDEGVPPRPISRSISRRPAGRPARTRRNMVSGSGCAGGWRADTGATRPRGASGRLRGYRRRRNAGFPRVSAPRPPAGP